MTGNEAIAALLEDRFTTTSTELAFAIFTVPKGLSPPFTLVDESVKDEIAGASTFSVPEKPQYSFQQAQSLKLEQIHQLYHFRE